MTPNLVLVQILNEESVKMWNKKITLGGNGKPLVDLWPGYSGPTTWGKWFVIQWPDEHPDSNCLAGKYVPDSETRACKICGWVPSDVINVEFKRLLREIVELKKLKELTEKNPRTKDLFTAYLAYVEQYAQELIGPPDFGALSHWWEKLSEEAKMAYYQKYFLILVTKVTIIFTVTSHNK